MPGLGKQHGPTAGVKQVHPCTTHERVPRARDSAEGSLQYFLPVPSRTKIDYCVVLGRYPACDAIVVAYDQYRASLTANCSSSIPSQDSLILPYHNTTGSFSGAR